MIGIDLEVVHELLQEVGRRYPSPERLYLIGGSGLMLVGSPRVTLDIDYVGRDGCPTAVQATLVEVALEMGLPIESVPIDEFVPVPPGAQLRHVLLRKFGLVETFLFDPYTIALSKLDRGLDTDMLDIDFMIKHGLVQIDQLKDVVADAIGLAQVYDLDRDGMLARLAFLEN